MTRSVAPDAASTRAQGQNHDIHVPSPTPSRQQLLHCALQSPFFIFLQNVPRPGICPFPRLHPILPLSTWPIWVARAHCVITHSVGFAFALVTAICRSVEIVLVHFYIDVVRIRRVSLVPWHGGGWGGSVSEMYNVCNSTAVVVGLWTLSDGWCPGIGDIVNPVPRVIDFPQISSAKLVQGG